MKFDLFVVSVTLALLALLALLGLLCGYGVTWLGSGSLIFVPLGAIRGGARPLFERPYRSSGGRNGGNARVVGQSSPRSARSALSARGRNPRPTLFAATEAGARQASPSDAGQPLPLPRSTVLNSKQPRGGDPRAA